MPAPPPPPDSLRDRAALALRTADFWRRATGIYAAYKGKQVQDAGLRLAGWSEERLTEELWNPHHEWAGRQMYELAVSVRGFYLKVRESHEGEWKGAGVGAREGGRRRGGERGG